ncbi:MAG: alpha/beta hydrolase family protein [Opitutaceae bacterium]
MNPREAVRQRLAIPRPVSLHDTSVAAKPRWVHRRPSAVALRLLAFAFLAFTGVALARGGEAAPEKRLPLPGEMWRIDGHTAFLIPAAEPPPAGRPKPWVWYAPTLPPYPGDAERWMFERFTRAGVAIAGIDVGESHGSPSGRAAFSALYAELTRPRGYSARPVLLGRSRGGLQLINWAAVHPAQVAAFAGIYPVCNLASYPGLAKAAPAYGLTVEQLTADLTRHNPVDRLAPLAAARVPFFAIHGDVDRLVPLEANSGLLRDRYTALGGTMTLIIPPGQGHSMWPGFFQSEELVAFVLKNAFR